MFKSLVNVNFMQLFILKQNINFTMFRVNGLQFLYHTGFHHNTVLIVLSFQHVHCYNWLIHETLCTLIVQVEDCGNGYACLRSRWREYEDTSSKQI